MSSIYIFLLSPFSILQCRVYGSFESSCSIFIFISPSVRNQALSSSIYLLFAQSFYAGNVPVFQASLTSQLSTPSLCSHHYWTCLTSRKDGGREEGKKSINRIVLNLIMALIAADFKLFKIFLQLLLGLAFVDHSAPLTLLWFHCLIIIWLFGYSHVLCHDWF